MGGLSTAEIISLVQLDDIEEKLEELKKAQASSSTRRMKGLQARLDQMEAYDTEAEGTLTADGSEQTLVSTSYGYAHHVEGQINLMNMQAGDTVVIKVYKKAASTDPFVLQASEVNVGVPTYPMLNISPRVGKYGVKITLQQTAGTNRNYTYIFFRSKKAE